jgi:hypothetical protein
MQDFILNFGWPGFVLSMLLMVYIIYLVSYYAKQPAQPVYQNHSRRKLS